MRLDERLCYLPLIESSSAVDSGNQFPRTRFLGDWIVPLGGLDPCRRHRSTSRDQMSIPRHRFPFRVMSWNSRTILRMRSSSHSR